MQTAIHLSGGKFHTLDIPSPNEIVTGSTRWGRHEELCTPAYWAAQAWMWEMEEPRHYRLGESLEEELLACLLGGYGIPAEIGLAAYERLRPLLKAHSAPLRSEQTVRDLLTEPLTISGRSVRYRFANQKARSIATALSELDAVVPSAADRELRGQLLKLRGVGPKTASWVVRNLRNSDEVAILDVHILRAGSLLGIFHSGLTVERNYFDLESAFLEFSAAIGARASILDSVMWMAMRRLPHRLLDGMAACHSLNYAPRPQRLRRAPKLPLFERA